MYEIPEENECSPDCDFSAASVGSVNKIDALDTDNKRVNKHVNRLGV